MKIAVVGAGISGLACAFELQGRGHRVVVYESLERVGGRMSTLRAGGLPVDLGANLLLANYGHTRALAGRVGLGADWFEFQAGHGGVLADGAASVCDPKSMLDMIRDRRFGWGARLRLLGLLLEAWAERPALEFFDLSIGDEDPSGEDAWTGVVRRCGEEVAANLVDPFVRTFHFHSSKRLAMKVILALAALFVGQGGFVPGGFRGGMGALPAALAGRLDLRAGTHVIRVLRRGSGWRLGHTRGQEDFDRVVLALPAMRARALLPDGPPRTTAFLEGVGYSSTMMCSYRVPREAAGDFEGYWVPYAESTLLCAVADEDCKGAGDARDVVVTIGLHDEAARALAKASDDQVLALVAAEWSRLMPRFAERMIGLHVQRWPAALPVYGVGEIARVKRYWTAGQGDEGLWLCGDHLNHPWVEGSVRCGQKVAAAIDPD